jgi:hypothetical protein
MFLIYSYSYKNKNNNNSNDYNNNNSGNESNTNPKKIATIEYKTHKAIPRVRNFSERYTQIIM